MAIGERFENLAHGLVQDFKGWCPGGSPKPYWGETPWIDLLNEAKPDVLFIATPDSLHTPPILAALERGAGLHA